MMVFISVMASIRTLYIRLSVLLSVSLTRPVVSSEQTESAVQGIITLTDFHVESPRNKQ